MKIAVVSVYCWDSTLPLIKHIKEEGQNVDFFGLVTHHAQSGYVIDFSKNKQPFGFVNKDIANNSINIELEKYLSGINRNFFVIPGGGRKRYLADIIYAYKLAKHLKKQNYDVIHLIHTNVRFWYFLLLFLKEQPIIQTLHEVTAHEKETNIYTKKILLNLIKWRTPIIFPSQTSYDRFQSFCIGKDSSNKTAIIRFGLYETYLCFQSEQISSKKDDNITILHFGRIVPYKGINFLIDAVKILQHKYKIHLIVAGDGKPYFDFDGVVSYEFIHKILSNEDIVSLIKRSDIVICPYSSASQSGIPMTVYPFCVPIIASNIAGFAEVIEHRKTGLLVDNLDANKLALSIEELIKSEELVINMERNIGLKYSEGEFSWPFIAKKTIRFYKSSINF